MAINYHGKTTEQYWKDRYKLSESLGERTEREMLNHIKGLYKNAISEINKEIEAFYGRYASMNELTLSEVRKRLNPDELKSAKYEINKYYSDIDRLARTASGKVSVELLRKYKERLRLQSAKAYMSRLEDLKNRLTNIVVNLGTQEDAVMHDSLLETAKYSYTQSAYNISKYTGFANTFSETQFDKLINERWLGANYSDRVWEDKRQLETQLEKTFLQGVVRGQNPRKIADEMQKNVGGSYYRSERLARTETLHILNESTYQSYADYGIKEYQFVCGLDERTCPECGSLDGEKFKLSEKIEGINYPVIHPNCRCTTIPYFEDLGDESTRVAYDESHKMYEVPADMTYSEWVDAFERN